VTTSEERSRQLRDIAATTFGWTELTPDQLRAMEQVAAGRDVLAVLPTGAGKSAIYQVPALLPDREGPTVVVSPLIALQHDQREGIAESDAPAAVAVNSAQRVGETREAWADIEQGRAEYLFLAPEQFADDAVLARVREAGPALFVVDEAHCVSEWGHDFRPEYLRLGAVVEQLGHPPVVALTATAAPPVRDDVVQRLGLRDPEVVVAGFDRPNLHLAVQVHAGRGTRDAEVVERVVELAAAGDGRGLVYCTTRRTTEEFAAALAARGVATAAYHGGLGRAARDEVHERFRDGVAPVVVATSAFGMGIDQPDVRFVVHAASPASLDEYYQQAGRGGRDGEPAVVELHHHDRDLDLQRFLTARRPRPDAVAAALGAVTAEPRTRREVREASGLSAQRLATALNLLEQTGAVLVDGEGRFTRGEPDAGGDPVEHAVALAERRRELVRSRIDRVRAYATTTDCRRRLLLGHFGEQHAEVCGRCDNCDAGTSREADTGAVGDGIGGEDGTAAVRHPQWGEGVVMTTEGDRVTVLFAEHGYKTLALDAVRERGLLRPVADGAGG
jgi:ATP-dependent DNA helicase RecQ